ncbi:hypothetical protein A3C67_03230 [Candidatus Nomurabacteria bacterium RIFCSPHIGHO2_02_FULL_42_19]|uniref:Arsenite methyltransferase n=1 Tax=Candidatus Nomurabacteria bacterium RIFCSPHIGHO2_02_FULL_42_19 TaxID=1801756 RepID=A0A1F6W317_9BACT|nr:MAG: hypothetical protein A3C67_03230 [Candidatus Nomurabacteria bacterium RIFCSPHIGHO2_02_FULL_42_19]
MFANPVKILRMFGLQENAVVADLGAGTGFYAVAAGEMVPKGKVYAVEVQKDFLPTIKNKAREAGLNNVEALWGDVEKIGGTKIGDNIVDAVIASNIFFQVEDKDKFIEETKRILKPGGRVLFIDWVLSPAVQQKAIVPQSKAREMFERKGFTYEKDIEAGAHHYGMILKKT